MGSILSTSQNHSSPISNIQNEHQSFSKSVLSNENLNEQLIQMKQLNRDLLAEYHPLESLDNHHQVLKHVQYQEFGQTSQGRKQLIRQEQTRNEAQNQSHINDLIIEYDSHRHEQSLATIAERVSSQYTSFRSSFISDQSQSSVYLQPPQFIMRSPTLMNLLNRSLMEFFDFSQFLGQIAIKIYQFGVNFVFLILLINFIIVYGCDFECLKVKNNGFIELEKWILMDSAVSSFVVVLLWIQNFYAKIYRYKLRRMKINQKIYIIQNSWIILYAIKYFVLNAVGSIQFFTYIAHQNQAETTLASSPESSLSSSITECPKLLNCYIMGVIIYNYLSVILLGVFVMENII